MTNITKFEKKSAARKHSIIKATADLIIENGVNNLTHREIAAKAKVPLGSTTQHFSSLDDLKAQALTYLADMLDDILQEIDVELARNSSPAKLAQLLYEYLQDTVRIHADVAFLSLVQMTPRSARWQRAGLMVSWRSCQSTPTRKRHKLLLYLVTVRWYIPSYTTSHLARR